MKSCTLRPDTFTLNFNFTLSGTLADTAGPALLYLQQRREGEEAGAAGEERTVGEDLAAAAAGRPRTYPCSDLYGLT